MTTNIKKLDTVSLLLAMEDPNPGYQKHALEEELKTRQLNEKQLKKAYEQKSYVQQQRSKKAETPLSTLYKVFLVAIPFTDSSKMMHQDRNTIDEYEDFIAQAGYSRKIKEIKKYKKIGAILWISIFILLTLYSRLYHS